MNQNTKVALILGAVLAVPVLLLGMASVATQSPPDQVAAPAPVAPAPAKPNVFDQFDNEPIDKNEVVWDQPAAQPQFSQSEIDRVNAALQARNDSIDAAKAAGRAAGEAYAEEQRRR